MAKDKEAYDSTDSSNADSEVEEEKKTDAKAKKGMNYKKSEEPEGEETTTEDELTKALTLLEEAGKSTDDEKQSLLSKAMDGSISQEENDRLTTLLSGRNAEPTLSEEVTKSLQPEADERLQKSLDVSEYLDAQHKAITESISSLADHIEKSDGRQHNFNVVLAKGVRAIGELVKSVEGRLANVEAQPVGGPKAVRAPAQAPLAKSFAGTEGGERLSKSQVLDVLEDMNKSLNGTARCGEDLVNAIAKYESTNSISRPLADELMQFKAGA